MRCRVPVEVTLPSHKMRKVSERTLTRAATCLNISVVKPGTFNRQAVLGKNPPDVRYDIIAWALSRLTPGRHASTSRLAVLMLTTPANFASVCTVRSSAISISSSSLITLGPVGAEGELFGDCALGGGADWSWPVAFPPEPWPS